MANESSDSQQNNKQKFKLTDLWALTLQNWMWVLLSLVVCLGLAFLYLKVTNPTYNREAAVIVKDENEGASLGGAPDLGFGDLGLFSNNSNFENEISTFRSPDYMEEVVKRLGLQTNYRVKKGLRKAELYGDNLPLTVTFSELPEDEGASISFTVYDSGDIILDRKMLVNGKKAELPRDMKVRFGVPFNTPAGKVTINKTENFGKGPRQRHNVEAEEEDKDKKYYVDRMSIIDATDKYVGLTDIDKENDKGATVINFSVKDPSKQRGDDILNTLIDVYNTRWGDEKNMVAVNTSKFIDERLSVIASELGDVDRAITDYKKNNLIIDIAANNRVTLEKGLEVDKQKIEMSNNLQMAKYLRDYMKKSGNEFQTLPVNLGYGSMNIERQIADYNEAVMHRNSLVANSSVSNPMVVDLDERIGSMHKSIMSSLETQVKTLETSIANLNKEESANNADIASNPEQINYLRTHGREQTVKEQLYLFLLQKKEENELSRSFAGQNIKVIRRPNGSETPYKPVPKMVYLMALVFGIGIPVSIIYAMETGNTKLRSRKDIEHLDLPLLGEIPQIKKKMGKDAKHHGDNIVVGEGQRDIVNESFRVIRTNLGFITSKDKEGSAIMVTSFIWNSGKTFVTMNLGVTCALQGKRILVVDCDLRHRSASSYIGSPKRGLTDYLNGTVSDLRSVIDCDSLVKNLCVLPAGTLAPNPTELLESERFSESIKELKKDYDYIFLDCPPTEMMADAQIVNLVTDRTIFILRAGNLPLATLPLLKQYYVEKKFKNISVILNGLSDVKRRGYGYGYGYDFEEKKGLKKILSKIKK